MNIIITGGSRGVGYETAKLLTNEHQVITISRNAGKNIIPGITPISFDFEKGDIANELLPEIKKHFHKIDVLINNAATFLKKPFEETTRKEFERIYSVNFFSIAELTRVLMPMLLSSTNETKKTHVLNISSMGGIQGSVKFPGLAAYSSGKGALITLTECLAQEYKDKNISFNAIAFGSVQTEMLEEAFPGFKAPISAEQAAKFVADFALSGNKYFNGKTLQMALSTP